VLDYDSWRSRQALAQRTCDGHLSSWTSWRSRASWRRSYGRPETTTGERAVLLRRRLVDRRFRSVDRASRLWRPRRLCRTPVRCVVGTFGASRPIRRRRRLSRGNSCARPSARPTASSSRDRAIVTVLLATSIRIASFRGRRRALDPARRTSWGRRR